MNCHFKVKKIVYYPKEIYFKKLNGRGDYFTLFKWKGRDYMIKKDHCNITSKVNKDVKDNLKIMAKYKGVSMNCLMSDILTNFVKTQTEFDIETEFRVLKNDDAYLYESSAILFEDLKFKYGPPKKEDKQTQIKEKEYEYTGED